MYKIINKNTARKISEFFESSKKIEVPEILEIFDLLNKESGQLIYNVAVAEDLQKIYDESDRCEDIGLCKYHTTILAIVMEALNITPIESTVFYEVSCDSRYKFKILSKICVDLMKTRDESFIRAVFGAIYSPGYVAECIVDHIVEESASEEEIIQKMREIDLVYKTIIKAKLFSKTEPFKGILYETGESTIMVYQHRYMRKNSKRKLTKEEIDNIFTFLKEYGMHGDGENNER